MGEQQRSASSSRASAGIPLHVTLSHYKRADVREAMAAQCRGKEVAIKFVDHFGKRPDMLVYDSDILRFAQRKATSFHVSEETWTNPMQLAPGMRQRELDALRTGWDLVLDIDFPVWEATREIASALVAQLRAEGLPDVAITAKFSGNKGFHLAVPWEAFPQTYTDDEGIDVLVSDLFPDGVRSVVEYLVHQIDGPDNGYALSEKLVSSLGRDALAEMLQDVCGSCGRKAPGPLVSGNEFVCPRCEKHYREDSDYMTCQTPGCGTLLRPQKKETLTCACGHAEFRQKLDLGIDTLLVSSRHMYRLVYSLHEKSGLVSVPVPIDRVGGFDRSEAEPSRVEVSVPFLDRRVPQDCALPLLARGLAFEPPGREERKSFSEVEWDGEAAPEEVFPPAIRKMLAGMQDGRQRALFVLTNFLKSVGWTYEMIEARLQEWNDANPEPLRSNVIPQHLRYHREKETVLPPNFDNDMYYKDLGVLEHDELSRRVKNPVQYVRLRLKQLGSTGAEGKRKGPVPEEDAPSSQG